MEPGTARDAAVLKLKGFPMFKDKLASPPSKSKSVSWMRSLFGNSAQTARDLAPAVRFVEKVPPSNGRELPPYPYRRHRINPRFLSGFETEIGWWIACWSRGSVPRGRASRWAGGGVSTWCLPARCPPWETKNAKKLILEGRATGSVSKKQILNRRGRGSGAPSSKKAQKLGVAVLSEDEFF